MRSQRIEFIGEKTILAYAEPLVTKSITLGQGTGESENGRTIAKAGTVIPANDATAEGILLSDIDTTDADVEAAVIIEGYVYEDRLPAELSAEAAGALKEIKVIER